MKAMHPIAKTHSLKSGKSMYKKMDKKTIAQAAAATAAFTRRLRYLRYNTGCTTATKCYTKMQHCSSGRPLQNRVWYRPFGKRKAYLENLAKKVMQMKQ